VLDISADQVKMAQTLAERDNLAIDFHAAHAEEQPFESHTFDVITANQCWLYFDKSKVIPEVKRLLKPEGVLVTSHFSWLPRVDKIAKASEELILKHNPQWSAANYSGEIPAFPSWAVEHFRLKGMFYYDEPIPFSRETWKGRIRACRGVGAALTEHEVIKFDQEHDTHLKNLAGEKFKVIHRLDAHIFTDKKGHL
jgi:SAM-dependent methyltransferase